MYCKYLQRGRLYLPISISADTNVICGYRVEGTLELLATTSVLGEDFVAPESGTTVSHVELSPCGGFAFGTRNRQALRNTFQR